MTAPRIYTQSASARRLARVGTAVLWALSIGSVVMAAIGSFGPDPMPARLILAGFGVFMGFMAASSVKQLREAMVQYTLRDDGIEVRHPDEAPQFVGWHQITGFRFSLTRGGFELLGAGDHLLAVLSARIEGVGELLNAVLARGVLPKRRTVLPFRGERSYPMIARLVFGLIAVIAILPLIATYGSPRWEATLLLPVVVAGAVLLQLFTTARAVVVDRTGVTLERRSGNKGWRWEEIAGGSLVVLRGSKGAISIAAALRLRAGKWEVLRIPGVDPLDLLAAIAASGPDRILAAPDRLTRSGLLPFGGSAREPTKVDDLLRYM